MAKLLGLLFEVTEIFDMQTRPELILLQKTMVVVEGVARGLDPEFDMWATAEPVVRDWIERNVGPAGQIERAVDALSTLSRVLGQVPAMAARLERFSADLDSIGEKGIRLHPDTVDGIGLEVAQHSRSGRMALWVIALSGAVIALTLLGAS